MSKKQDKSSRLRLQSFPEETSDDAGYNVLMVASRQRQRDQDPRLVCHRDYDKAHSQEHESLDDIEVLSPKQNGSTVDTSGHEAPKAHNKASIKGMWKKAFKSLKTTDSKGNSKEKEEKIDRQESKYSRMLNNRLAVEQGRRSKSQEYRTRKTSSDKYPNASVNSPPKSPRPSPRIELLRRTASEPKPKHNYDSAANDSPKSSRQSSLRKFLRRSESKEIREKDGYAQQDSNDKSSRQSSLKRLMRKDSKEKEQPSTPSDSELGTCVEEQKIDPVYSLLKCAADLPRQNKPGPQGHACCGMMRQELNAVRNSSRSSSPSSDDAKSSGCTCPCHTPELLANYHDSLIQSNKKKSRGRKT